MNLEDRSPPKLRVVYFAPAHTIAVGGVRRFDEELRRTMRAFADLIVIETLPSEDSLWRRVPAIGPITAKSLAFIRARRRVRELEHEGKVDLVFHPFYWPPRISKFTPSIGFIHDLRMVGAHNRQQLKLRSIKGRLVKYAIKSWDVVCVPSPHVADDVTLLVPWVLPEVVGEGLDHLPLDESVVRDRVLVLTGTAPHKQPEIARELAVKIYDEIGLPVTVLGLEGGSWVGGRDITTLQHVEDRELTEALGRGLVCVATTAYEGFGLSVGEAMRAGCPIVFGANSGLRFLVGDSGIEVDPTTEGYAGGLIAALGKIDMLRRESSERARGFLWADTAEKILFSKPRSSPGIGCQSPQTLEAVELTKQPDDPSPYWTVIIPTFNRCTDVCRAIDSVLSQDLEDFELLVIDDASSDQTLEVLATYDDRRLRVFRHPLNRGAAEARNTGIRNSRGEFVAFLDSDDYWRANKLSTLQAELATVSRSGKAIDVICHSSQVLTKLESKTSPLQAFPEMSLQARLLSGEFIQTSSVAVRRSLAQLVYFDQSMTPYEDWDFLFRCADYIKIGDPLIIPETLSVHDARNQSGRLSQDEGARIAGARMLRRNLLKWSRSERASFLILRQLHTERRIRPRRSLFIEIARQAKAINHKTSRHWVSAVNCLLPRPLSLAKRLKKIWTGLAGWSLPSNGDQPRGAEYGEK